MYRKLFIAVFIAFSISSVAPLAPAVAADNSFPDRPIRLIAPYAAGGLTDIAARIVAEKLSRRIGQPVVVENRTGAGGIIGVEMVAKSKPDGYTLALVGQGLASVNESLYPNLKYETLADFKPISLVAKFSLVLVGNPQKAPDSLIQALDLGRKSPDSLSYGSAGTASTAHLAMELFNDQAGIKSLHVPFRGESPAFAELVGGRIDMMFATLGGVLPLVNSGKLRPLAVASKERNPLLPNTPTVSEGGVPGYDVFGWYGILAPASTPDPIIARLSKELMAIGQDPEFQEAMRTRGMEAVGGTPEDLTTTIRDETLRWKALIEKASIQAE
jgi:tripartite-type tricarboxylate transporter receptor subunit TctC